MFILSLAATLMMAASSPSAPAATETTPPAAAATPVTPVAKSDKDRMICKTEALAGSRVPKKVCATKSEWDARRQEDRDQLEKAQKAASAPRGF